MAEEKEQINGQEEVFEGGPTKDQVENWKHKYGDVYMTKFDSETFIWRTISRSEYKEVLNMESEGDQPADWFREEVVTDRCVIWPTDFDYEDIGDGKAGIPAVLAEKIMNKSGFIAEVGAKKL